ncbi:type 4b pilus protein PilO2 [Serratia quinivorans]|uniref:type 4b pilus protein PilO2 n=1 Tax=Serratia quinivorans TaxID=137545 RepID=UPI0021BABA46|nr:type 4b pilus protein PilO2 [Serratia quinivorans]
MASDKSQSKKAVQRGRDGFFYPLNKQDYVVAGLIWQPLEGGKGGIKKRIAALLKQEQRGCYLLNQQKHQVQCGLTSVLPYPGKRYYSAVLLLRSTLGDSWIGLFALPEAQGWWLGAIHDGMVVPGCDVIFTDTDAAQASFERMRNLFPWQRILISAGSNIAGEAVDAGELFRQAKTSVELRIIDSNALKQQARKLTVYGVGGLLAIAAALGGWRYYQQQQEAERLARIQAEAARQQQQRQQIKEAWRNKPSAAAFLYGCQGEISRFPTGIIGWRASAVLCDGQRVKAIYQRTPAGTLKSFTAWAAQQQSPYEIQLAGEQVQINTTLRLEGGRQYEELRPIKSQVSDMLEKIQTGLAKGKIEDVLTGDKMQAKFELSSELSPALLMQGLHFDGLVVERMLATINAQGVMEWKITGVMYGKE